MPFVKMYFKDGIPTDAIIKSWGYSPAFQGNQVSINKHLDNKTISIFVELSSSTIENWLVKFHADFWLTWNQEVMFLFVEDNDDGNVIGFYINDGKPKFSHSLSMNFCSENSVIEKSNIKQKIRFVKSFGFDDDFIRFIFVNKQQPLIEVFNNYSTEEDIEEMLR